MAPVAVTEQKPSVLQQKYNQSAMTRQKHDVVEDYDGSYKFAPITEAEVSRAMIKRYVLCFFAIEVSSMYNPLKQVHDHYVRTRDFRRRHRWRWECWIDLRLHFGQSPT